MKTVARPMGILGGLFCMGLFATLAQVLFLREMLVSFLGNELTIGTILGCWLTGIAVGSALAARVRRRAAEADAEILRGVLAALLVGLSLLLPLQVYAIRIARLLLGVPTGQYASFGAIFLGSFLVLLPTCAGIGLFFPLACEAWHRSGGGGEEEGSGSLSAAYTVESVGSAVGGVLLTFALLPHLSPYRVVAAGVAAGFLGAALLEPRARVRGALWALTLLALFAATVYPPWLRWGEEWTVRARWKAHGVLLSGPAAAHRPPVRLVAWCDSVYQNLAVTESEGQYVLYGNGQVFFMFPEPSQYEHHVHFLMAQNPNARRVLLIGGNPVDEIPEILKYPVERLVYLEVDTRIADLLAEAAGPAYRRALGDRRVVHVAQDGPAYVKRCRETFDAILVNAPEPTTIAANRYFTVEFFRDLRRILAPARSTTLGVVGGPSGFVATAVSSSERLQAEATDLGASVFQSLRQVFPVVLATAEARNRLVAGGEGAGLTLDRQTLFERSRGAKIVAQYYRPEYLLGADEISEDKTRLVAEKFSAARVPLNTVLQPITPFYSLFLWGRFSDSAAVNLLAGLRRVDARAMAAVPVVFGALLLGIGLFRGRRREPADAAGRSGAWARLMMGVLVGLVGFTGMAAEIVLVFLFQSLYGYVYTKMGLIVAAFMVGLTLGAPSGRVLASRGLRRSWASLAAIEVGGLACFVALPWIAGLAAGSQASAGWLEVGAYVAVALAGWAVGAEFVLVNRIVRETGAALGAAAAGTNAADHVGAALGALVTGVVLVPVAGIAGTCWVLAATKAAGLCCLLSARACRPVSGVPSEE